MYWRNADIDLMVIYNALVMNDGKPQMVFDHTAYLTILAIKSWLPRLLIASSCVLIFAGLTRLVVRD